MNLAMHSESEKTLASREQEVLKCMQLKYERSS